MANSLTKRKQKWTLFHKLWRDASRKPGYEITTWKRLRDVLAAEDEDVDRLREKVDILFGNGRFASSPKFGFEEGT